MASKPAPSSKTTPSSSNVQSTNNNKKNEQVPNETTHVDKTVRPPSAQKTPVTDAAAAGISPGASAAGSGEVNSSTVTSQERPPSASKQPATTASNENRPGSAAKQTSDDAALQKKDDPTITPALGDATAAVTNARPPSGNTKLEDTVAKNAISAGTGSRLGSASRKQDDGAASNSTASPGARPASGTKKPGETTSNHGTTEQQDASAAPIDPNDPNITKPVIGRPASGAKKESLEELVGGPVASASPPISSSVETPAAPAGPPPPTPRAGSASKKPT